MNPAPILRRHALAAYFVLAFGISWGAILLVIGSSGVPGRGPRVAELFPLVFSVMLLGPSLASLTLTAATAGRAGLRDLFGRFGRWRLGRWYGAALITPVVLVVLGSAGIVRSEFLPSLARESDRGPIVLMALGWGLAAGFLEEIGWTGFALPRMQARWGWLRAGILLGLPWGLWHLLADYWGAGDAWDGLYATRFLLWCIASFTAYRVLISWAYGHTGSLLLAQLMHAGFTGGQALLEPPLDPGASSLVWYAAFALILWAAVLVVALAEGRLRLPAAWPHARGETSHHARVFGAFL